MSSYGSPPPPDPPDEPDDGRTRVPGADRRSDDPTPTAQWEAPSPPPTPSSAGSWDEAPAPAAQQGSWEQQQARQTPPTPAYGEEPRTRSASDPYAAQQGGYDQYGQQQYGQQAYGQQPYGQPEQYDQQAPYGGGWGGPQDPGGPGGPGGGSGGPGGGRMPSRGEASGFLGALFDFSFTTFVTPMIVKFVYVLAVVALGLGFLLFLVSAIASGEALLIIGTLLLGPVLILIYLCFIRMTLELYLAITRMSQDINRRLPETPGQS